MTWILMKHMEPYTKEKAQQDLEKMLRKSQGHTFQKDTVKEFIDKLVLNKLF